MAPYGDGMTVPIYGAELKIDNRPPLPQRVWRYLFAPEEATLRVPASGGFVSPSPIPTIRRWLCPIGSSWEYPHVPDAHDGPTHLRPSLVVPAPLRAERAHSE